MVTRDMDLPMGLTLRPFIGDDIKVTCSETSK